MKLWKMANLHISLSVYRAHPFLIYRLRYALRLYYLDGEYSESQTPIAHLKKKELIYAQSKQAINASELSALTLLSFLHVFAEPFC